MKSARILIVGGGIGGLTAAIALRQKGFEVDLLERNPPLTVYGVGIIQQANVIRAFAQLGMLREYASAGFGFDFVSMFSPGGDLVAKIPAPRLVDTHPANLGISRRALHQVLTDSASRLGAHLEFGRTTTRLEDRGDSVWAHFEDRPAQRYDLAIGADGIYSGTRAMLFPEAAAPAFTGQGVWRYNFPRPPELDGIWAYLGAIGVGLVPLSSDEMYMFVTTPEPDARRPDREGLARRMADRLQASCAAVLALGSQIRDDAAVVYRPLEWLFIRGPWYRGRVVLIGDAIHATTPHLGQGAGMAIEDAIVLAEELVAAEDLQAAFQSYQARRFARCEYITEKSKAICFGQLGTGPVVDHAQATREMFGVVSQPI